MVLYSLRYTEGVYRFYFVPGEWPVLGSAREMDAEGSVFVLNSGVLRVKGACNNEYQLYSESS